MSLLPNFICITKKFHVHHSLTIKTDLIILKSPKKSLNDKNPLSEQEHNVVVCINLLHIFSLCLLSLKNMNKLSDPFSRLLTHSHTSHCEHKFSLNKR